ncbi:MAG TPA: rhodanese-like domain-containing protein [Pedococcus sp.]|nr:rhodanese-like domain-containing protein [Pedococcus sp.]
MAARKVARGDGRPSAADLAVARAREQLRRLSPTQARDSQLAGALLVDTRTAAQREVQGELPDAIVIDRTVLEWRLDRTSPSRIPEADDAGLVIVVCRQGYSSSLAAASLRGLGIDATDIIGGVEAWIAAGLPTGPGPADVRE